MRCRLGMTTTLLLLGAGVAGGGEFEDLGVPVRKAGLMGWLTGPDAAGEQTKLYLSFNQDGAPLFLVQVDPVTGEVKQYSAPAGNPGGWGFIVGLDKCVYIGTWGGGHVLRFDPKQPDKGIEFMGKPSKTESYIWQFTIGRDGKLYGCTYPQAKIVSYDPATGEMADHGRMDPVEQYSRTIATGKNGWIYTGIGSVKAQIAALNPETAERRSIVPEDARGTGWGQVHNGADGNAYGKVGSAWYRLVDGTGIPIETADMRNVAPQVLQDGRVLTSATLTGDYSLYNPNTEKTEKHAFAYQGAGSGIFVVGEGPGGVIYGSTAMPLEMFSYDPTTGKTANPGNPTSAGGELYSLVPLDGELFVCAYPGSWLSRYDPKRPWKYGTTPEHNPYGIGQIGDGHLRPRAMIVGPGGTLYIGSYPAYGQWGGAMAVFDPATNKVVENYRHLIQDQAIVALAYDADSGLVFGGSSTTGGGGTKPKAKEARFFAWDPVKKEKSLDVVPVSGSSSVTAMCIAAGKVFVVSSGSTCSVFDIVSRTFVHQAKLPFGSVREISLGLHSDGMIYGLSERSIFRISPRTFAATEVAKPPVSVRCGWAMTDTGIYFGSGVHLWRYRW